jgi:hypothetical protein
MMLSTNCKKKEKTSSTVHRGGNSADWPMCLQFKERMKHKNELKQRTAD